MQPHRGRAKKGITLAINVPKPQGLTSVTSASIPRVHAANANHPRLGGEEAWSQPEYIYGPLG